MCQMNPKYVQLEKAAPQQVQDFDEKSSEISKEKVQSTKAGDPFHDEIVSRERKEELCQFIGRAKLIGTALVSVAVISVCWYSLIALSELAALPEPSQKEDNSRPCMGMGDVFGSMMGWSK